MITELSLNDLNNELRIVTNWHGLGLQLDVPGDELERIEQNYPRSAERKMSEVLKYWWRNCPTERRSWQTIAAALKNIGYKNLAKTLESYVNTQTGTCMYVYTYTMFDVI